MDTGLSTSRRAFDMATVDVLPTVSAIYGITRPWTPLSIPEDARIQPESKSKTSPGSKSFLSIDLAQLKQSTPTKLNQLAVDAKQGWRAVKNKTGVLLRKSSPDQVSKRTRSKAVPRWMQLAHHARDNPAEFRPDGDEIADRSSVLNDKIPINPKATAMVAAELRRLSDLLIDDKAEMDDIALYILFSFAMPDFNAANFGRSKSSSRHVLNPPFCRVLHMYYAIDSITDRPLQLIAMRTFGMLAGRINDHYYNINCMHAVTIPQVLLVPKVRGDIFYEYY